MRIYLEITNICNKACKFCLQTERKKEFLSYEKFANRIRKIENHVDELYLHLLGESFLHPNFCQFIELINTTKIPLKITSNGTLLNSDIANKLISSKNFKQINFSLHALSNSEIEGGELEKILEFSRELCNKRDDIYINYRFWNSSAENHHTNQIILDKISAFFQIPKIIVPENRRSKKIMDKVYLNLDKVFQWPTTVQKDENNHIIGRCHGGSSQLGILVDGRVTICCLDSEAECSFGNIDEVEDFSEILNSSKLKNIIKGFENNQVIDKFCQKCTFHLRFSK